jgi:hypothetical protein
MRLVETCKYMIVVESFACPSSSLITSTGIPLS